MHFEVPRSCCALISQLHRRRRTVIRCSAVRCALAVGRWTNTEITLNCVPISYHHQSSKITLDIVVLVLVTNRWSRGAEEEAPRIHSFWFRSHFQPEAGVVVHNIGRGRRIMASKNFTACQLYMQRRTTATKVKHGAARRWWWSGY